MPSKSHRKAARKPRRSPDGRFKGEPRTLSETSMPDEYAPGAEAPREAASGKPVCAVDLPQSLVSDLRSDMERSDMDVSLSDADIKRAISRVYGIRIRSVGPWYRRLWAAVREWLR